MSGLIPKGRVAREIRWVSESVFIIYSSSNMPGGSLALATWVSPAWATTDASEFAQSRV